MSRDKQVIFAAAEGADGVPFVLLGITKKAWEHMQEWKSHNFDLTKAGIPVRIAMFSGEDSADVMKTIDRAMAQNGVAYLDERGENFSIDDKEKN